MTLLSFSTVYGNAETLTTIKICENAHQIHFGSQYFTECALRRSPCQSELAELREPAIHPEGNAIFGYDGGNHFCKKRKNPSEGCLLPASENKDTCRKQQHRNPPRAKRPAASEGVWKNFVKFAGITGLRKMFNRIKKI